MIEILLLVLCLLFIVVSRVQRKMILDSKESICKLQAHIAELTNTQTHIMRDLIIMKSNKSTNTLIEHSHSSRLDALN